MVKLKELWVSVAYSQIIVCDKHFVEQTYEFTSEEIKQGFLCVLGYTIFRTLWDATNCFVEIHADQEIRLEPDVIRAISVPFSLKSPGKVRVFNSMISTDEEIQVESGEYTLLFQNGIDKKYIHTVEQAWSENKFHPDVPMWCQLTFVPKVSGEPEILKLDKWLSPSYPLLFYEESDQQ